ncbi:hypothetical protein F4781DRAFT_443329 [Annulohypoxylon bovei var. microspora]|nr:hypothetical protein F4781DRAFT_443329 [Annulohypoxylon bovei var. microspora]
MFQLPVSGPNLFLRDEEIIAAGSKDSYVFPYSLDGTTMSDSQRETQAEPAENCGWRGDSPEPQLDGITHDEQLHLRLPDDTCSWHGDPAEPELDDLAHHSEDKQTPKLSPKSQKPSHIHPQLLAVEPRPLDTPPKKENPKSQKKAPKVPPKEKPAEAPPTEKSPEEEQPPEDADETLQEKVTHGVQQALNIFQNILKSPEQLAEPEPSEGQKAAAKEEDILSEPHEAPPAPPVAEPQPTKGKKSKEDKEKAKKEKVEAKKAEKEKKVQEKVEKKRLKKEKGEAKKEERRKSKDKKKNKGKETTSPPPELPAGSQDLAAAEPDPHPGCHICQYPEEEATIEFLKKSLESWQGLPTLDDLTATAKKLLEPADTQQTDRSTSWNEQELIDHVVAHIDSHIHQYFDLDSPEGGNQEVGKAPPLKPNPNAASNGEPAASGKQLENGGPTNHGLDGNRDWPMTIMQDHILRSLEPMSTPDVATTQSLFRDYSPCRVPTSRCVSPWCEQLGFRVDDSPPSFAKRNASWLRRG